MDIGRDFRRALSMPPHVVVARAVTRAVKEISKMPRRRRDLAKTTFANSPDTGDLLRYIPSLFIELLHPRARQVCALSAHFVAHRFDLLGSGWVPVRHGMHCRGLEGHRYVSGAAVQADPEGEWLNDRISVANLDECRRVWRLIEQPYVPIDWQLDFKSGFRWSESTWYADIAQGRDIGADIKVPWELARMQHLPQFVYAFALQKEAAGSAGAGERDDCGQQYFREYRNQVLDFVATNPPRFGVNWACSMDVAVRVVNWLVSYDLFRADGARFDAGFESVLKRSVYEHGLHIINHLEWLSQLRANHYLANVAGLLFVAAYLPRTPETDAWLAFAVQELVSEVEHQFTPDGANFEASTNYHRLSAEMTTYATALVLGLPEEKIAALKTYDHSLVTAGPKLKPAPIAFFDMLNSARRSPFPAWYFDRLERMAEFTVDLTKPDGAMVQIGDNDSGRFLKVNPTYHLLSVAKAKSVRANLDDYSDLPENSEYWMEEALDHSHLVSAIGGIVNGFVSGNAVEQWLVSSLCRGPVQQRTRTVSAAESVRIGSDDHRCKMQHTLAGATADDKQVRTFPFAGQDLRTGLRLLAYPDFGVYLFRSQRLYLAIRCGPIGMDGFGGHAHNDQLAIELSVGGEDIVIDPGTYVYTPLPQRRDQYRGVGAHFAPRLSGLEPAQFEGPFKLADTAHAECIYFGPEGFVGRHWGYGSALYRVVRVEAESVSIEDWLEGAAGKWGTPAPPRVSPAYGVVLR